MADLTSDDELAAGCAAMALRLCEAAEYLHLGAFPANYRTNLAIDLQRLIKDLRKEE